MSLEFRKIEDKNDKYYSLLKALSWDLKSTYSLDRKMGVEWLLQKMIGVYDDDELIALGCIRKYYDIDEAKSYANLSSIVDRRYRRKGIANKLLKEMLEYCKELDVEMVKVEILKSNKASVRKKKKNDFDFVEFDDKIIKYEKKLINDK